MNKNAKESFSDLRSQCTIPAASTRVVEEDPPPQAERAGGFRLVISLDHLKQAVLSSLHSTMTASAAAVVPDGDRTQRAGAKQT